MSIPDTIRWMNVPTSRAATSVPETTMSTEAMARRTANTMRATLTTTLATGDHVRMDGAAGSVTVLGDDEAVGPAAAGTDE